jgi:hypothetical protein
MLKVRLEGRDRSSGTTAAHTSSTLACGSPGSREKDRAVVRKIRTILHSTGYSIAKAEPPID